jgi:drug/metabolite transporter (DMT)-like permease
MGKEQPSLFRGALYALATAALLATQAPLSLLGAKRLGAAEFISVTELVLLLCVPFMLRTQRSREHFRGLISSVSNLGKFGVLLLIGLIGIVLYALGLGRGHPIVISAVLNLDPFWAAIIAYLIAGKKIPTSLWTFTLCLAVAFVGAMLLAISQADTPSLSLEIFDSGSLLAAGLALPVPVLWALSGSLVGKWFADVDESACIAVTFITAAAVVVPVTLAVAYAQSGLTIKTDILPAIALLAAGTILATGVGRVLYQKALTVTDNNNGFVSIFFLLPLTGGFPASAERCAQVAANRHEGFRRLTAFASIVTEVYVDSRRRSNVSNAQPPFVNLPNGSIRPAAVLPIQPGNVREGRKADIGVTRGPIPGASSSRVSGPRELAMRMGMSLAARTARASRPAPVMAYVMSVSTSVVAGNSSSGSRPRGAYLRS